MRFPRMSLTSILFYGAITVAIVAVLRTSSDTAHAQGPGTAADSVAAREAAWNAPNMLRARAWLNEYCQSSDVVTEGQAAAHMQALESMTPEQMKLFAMTHEAAAKSHPAAKAQQTHQQILQHAAQAAAAQQWWYKNVHKAESQRALQADAASQQELGAISQEETSAANQAESQLQSEQAFARENQASKLDELNSPYPGLGYGDGYGAGYPATHYHFHLYPSP